ncbi:MAG: TlpA disulfide reductase family protein, partial [Bacteroidota bacterium]
FMIVCLILSIEKSTMKYFISFLLLTVSVSAMALGTVKIQGKVLNRSSDTICFNYNTNRIAFYPKPIISKLDKNGAFSISFPVMELHTQGELIYNGKRMDMVVTEGNDLTLNFDANDIENTMEIKGNGVEVANFVIKHFFKMGSMNLFGGKMQQYASKEPVEFVTSMNEEKQKELDYLEQNKNELSKDFIRYWKSFYEYFTYFDILQYPSLHEMIRQQSYNIQFISKENYESAKKVPELFNDTLMDVVPYRLYVDNIYRIKLEAENYTNIDTIPESKYRQDDSITRMVYQKMPDKTAEYFFASRLYNKVRNQPLKRTEANIEEFKKHWPQSMYASSLMKELALMSKISPGEPAMDFTFTTIDGMKSRLSDLMGKVVVLSFWSAENEGSAKQIVFMKRLSGKFVGKDVAFLYVSIDNNEEAWKMMIEKNKLSTGIHTRSPGSWGSIVAQDYGVVSIPAYFLIDKAGRFAIQNVPAPYMGDKLENEIKKLLK